MAPVVYLHVGAPKTGTSFLKDILWKNRAALAEEGVTLPGTRRGVFRATVDLRERPLEHRSPLVPGAWQRLVDEVLACSGTAVVSHELFSGVSEEQARRAVESLRPADLHVVYTARDLGRQIPAEWQQRVKHRRTAPMGEFVHEVVTRGPRAEWFWRVQDPPSVLARWGAYVPPDRVHLITVPPAGADPAILWRRFGSLIGIDPDRYDTQAARTNTSLGAAEAELLRRVNVALGDRLPLPGQHDRYVKEVLANEVLAALGGKARFGMRIEHQSWLAEESRRIVDEIGKLDYDVVGDLDELLPAALTPTDHPDDVTDAAVAAAGIDALIAVLERLRDQTVQTQTARRRARERHVAAPRLGGAGSRSVKQVLIDVSRKHRFLRVARRRYWRLVNAVRAVRAARK